MLWRRTKFIYFPRRRRPWGLIVTAVFALAAIAYLLIDGISSTAPPETKLASAPVLIHPRPAAVAKRSPAHQVKLAEQPPQPPPAERHIVATGVQTYQDAVGESPPEEQDAVTDPPPSNQVKVAEN